MKVNPLRVLVKALILYVVANILFAIYNPPIRIRRNRAYIADIRPFHQHIGQARFSTRTIDHQPVLEENHVR